jgi:hypothetical protein
MIENDYMNPCDKCRRDACANLWLYVLMDKVFAHTHGCTFFHDERKRCADNPGRLWQYMQHPWLDESLIRWVAANATCMYARMYTSCVFLYVCVYLSLFSNHFLSTR